MPIECLQSWYDLVPDEGVICCFRWGVNWLNSYPSNDKGRASSWHKNLGQMRVGIWGVQIIRRISRRYKLKLHWYREACVAQVLKPETSETQRKTTKVAILNDVPWRGRMSDLSEAAESWSVTVALNLLMDSYFVTIFMGISGFGHVSSIAFTEFSLTVTVTR